MRQSQRKQRDLGGTKLTLPRGQWPITCKFLEDKLLSAQLCESIACITDFMSQVRRRQKQVRRVRREEDNFFCFFFHFFSSPRLVLRTRFALHAKCHVHLPWLIKHLLCRLMKVYLRSCQYSQGISETTDLAILSAQRLSRRQFYCSMSCDLEVTSESAYCWRKNKLNNNYLLPLLNVAQALIECTVV